MTSFLIILLKVNITQSLVVLGWNKIRYTWPKHFKIQPKITPLQRLLVQANDLPIYTHKATKLNLTTIITSNDNCTLSFDTPIITVFFYIKIYCQDCVYVANIQEKYTERYKPHPSLFHGVLGTTQGFRKFSLARAHYVLSHHKDYVWLEGKKEDGKKIMKSNAWIWTTKRKLRNTMHELD
jgi:hypothetical protein